ncbi:MAG: hypothetical protein PVH78_01205 [Deltaproteobacteria bacterium]|jgi:hypothetical protein
MTPPQTQGTMTLDDFVTELQTLIGGFCSLVPDEGPACLYDNEKPEWHGPRIEKVKDVTFNKLVVYLDDGSKFHIMVEKIR